MPSVPAMPRAWRKTANRVRQRSGRRPPASSPRPVLSRHRIQRLVRSLSCCWGMPEKSRTFLPSKPRRCICQASRGYSVSQPAPSARSATCRRDQASRAIALLRFLPNASRHSCSVRSSSEDAPLAARNRIMIITTNGGALPSRSSWRRCRAYCTSSLSCAGRPSTLIRSWREGRVPFRHRGSVDAANSPASGRPAAAHRCRCPWQSPWPAAVRSHPGTRHGFPPSTGSRGSKTSSSARNSGRTAPTSFSSRPGGPASRRGAGTTLTRTPPCL